MEAVYKKKGTLLDCRVRWLCIKMINEILNDERSLKRGMFFWFIFVCIAATIYYIGLVCQHDPHTF